MKVCNSAQNLTMFLRFVLDFMISASSFDESLAGVGGVNKRIVVNVVVVSVSILLQVLQQVRKSEQFWIYDSNCFIS